MATILQPPNYEPVFPDGPIVFTAGPIQGAPDWQSRAFNIFLRDGPPKLTVANPRKSYAEGAFVYEEQVDWEVYWLMQAGARGVIMFWLAAQAEETPGRAYGQTSRFELGEWIGRRLCGYHVRLVIGIESGFGNERYIRRRVAAVNDATSYLGMPIPVLDSLEETCQTVLDTLR